MDRIAQLKEFLASSPEDPFLIHALALEYRKIEKYEDALAQFLLNKEKNPDYVGTYYHLGQLYEWMDREDAAKEVYEIGMEKAKAQEDQHAFNELRSVYEELIF